MIDEEKIANAIAVENFEFIKYFVLTYGIDYKFRSRDGDSLFSYALSDGGSNSYKFLLEYSPNLNIINDEGENIVHSVVYSGIPERLDILKPYLDNKINMASNDGTTPILLATILNKENMFLKLLEFEANIHIPDQKLVFPIHAAAMMGNVNIVEKLIEKGANLYSKTMAGHIPLSLAANNLHKEVILLLCKSMYS
jgi:ankyrin repeat protein